MKSQNWILGAVLAIALAALVMAIGGPGWAVGLGLVAGFAFLAGVFRLGRKGQYPQPEVKTT